MGGFPQNSGTAGEPDGYDGIARRGSYERLLVSEWLLHDELPDEFVRRVISGEHSFLQLARSQETSEKRTVVLFDSGPEQLGAPRIAHLAALIVLAQRAEQHRAQLEWGIFQDGTNTLHQGLNEALIRDLLRSRCLQPVSLADVERWAAVKNVASASERWFVGDVSLSDWAQKNQASMLSIADLQREEISRTRRLRRLL